MRKLIACTTGLGLLAPACYILFVTTHSEAATDFFIAVTLFVPLAILAVAYVLANRWDILSLKPTLFIAVGYVLSLIAYQICMASFGYGRFALTIIFDSLIWLLIVVAILALRFYAATELIKNDMYDI